MLTLVGREFRRMKQNSRLVFSGMLMSSATCVAVVQSSAAALEFSVTAARTESLGDGSL